MTNRLYHEHEHFINNKRGDKNKNKSVKKTFILGDSIVKNIDNLSDEVMTPFMFEASRQLW